MPGKTIRNSQDRALRAAECPHLAGVAQRALSPEGGEAWWRKFLGSVLANRLLARNQQDKWGCLREGTVCHVTELLNTGL